MAPVGDRPPAGAGPHSQPQQRAQQRQYASKPSRSQAATPASEAADMRLEFQQQQQQQPSSRTISAPTSPAKTRDSILQRVQSLTDAAKEKASSISNDIKCKSDGVTGRLWSITVVLAAGDLYGNRLRFYEFPTPIPPRPTHVRSARVARVARPDVSGEKIKPIKNAISLQRVFFRVFKENNKISLSR